MLKKRSILLVILILYVLGLAISINAEHREKREKKLHIGFFVNLSVQHSHNVYTDGLKWGREGPDTSFKESYYNVSWFRDNRVEFDLFYRKFEANSMFIADGFWDTEKIILGASLGKVLTTEIKIPSINISIPIDFAGGPYVALSLKNKYHFISGIEDLNVIDHKDPILGYGIYTSVKFRLNFSQKKRRPMLNVGFKYFIPFNDFEYNPEKEAVSYRLERKFFYIGISY